MPVGECKPQWFVSSMLGSPSGSVCASLEQDELTIAAFSATGTGVLDGIACCLEFLERHLAVQRVEKDVPVLEAHGCTLVGSAAVGCK